MARRQIDQQDLYLGCVLRLRENPSKKDLDTVKGIAKQCPACQKSVEAIGKCTVCRKPRPTTETETIEQCIACQNLVKRFKRCSELQDKTPGHPAVVLKVTKLCETQPIGDWIVTIATFCSSSKTSMKNFCDKCELNVDPFLTSSIPVHHEHRIEHPELYLTAGRKFCRQSYLSYLKKYCVPASMLESFEGMPARELAWIDCNWRWLNGQERLYSEASRMTLRLNWPSYKLAMALFGDLNVSRSLYQPNTYRHGSTLAYLYLYWLRQQLGHWMPGFANLGWMMRNGFH